MRGGVARLWTAPRGAQAREEAFCKMSGTRDRSAPRRNGKKQPRARSARGEHLITAGKSGYCRRRLRRPTRNRPTAVRPAAAKRKLNDCGEPRAGAGAGQFVLQHSAGSHTHVDTEHRSGFGSGQLSAHGVSAQQASNSGPGGQIASGGPMQNNSTPSQAASWLAQTVHPGPLALTAPASYPAGHQPAEASPPCAESGTKIKKDNEIPTSTGIVRRSTIRSSLHPRRWPTTTPKSLQPSWAVAQTGALPAPLNPWTDRPVPSTPSSLDPLGPEHASPGRSQGSVRVPRPRQRSRRPQRTPWPPRPPARR